mmetsp:Transcript_15836/g.52211  ORF Transcript_15836/g.52211 Transcript_15836/m.52211 type:complete len:238 (+) Transcript_15836:454-1167(+)
MLARWSPCSWRTSPMFLPSASASTTVPLQQCCFLMTLRIRLRSRSWLSPCTVVMHLRPLRCWTRMCTISALALASCSSAAAALSASSSSRAANGSLEPLSASRSMRGNENPVFGEGSRSHIQGWRRQAHALCVCCARSSRCDARATTGSVVQCVCVDQGLALCRALATGQGWRGRARVGPADCAGDRHIRRCRCRCGCVAGSCGCRARRRAAGGGRSAGAGGERDRGPRLCKRCERI